jgi:hypothetical protein
VYYLPGPHPHKRYHTPLGPFLIAAPSGSGSDGTDPGGEATPGAGGTSSGSTKTIQKIGTRTNVSGGITEPLTVATAGFVVYVDGNGNGKLDLEGEYASSPDTILGGNKELILAYLKGGGQLDYEKLRDKSGILPNAGFNLAWDEGRWLPLSLVELQLTDKAKLPSAICSSGYAVSGSGGSGGSVPPPELTEEEPDQTGPRTNDNTAPPPDGYPAAGSPGLYCYDNGHSFYYTGDCPPSPPPPVGLCANGYGESTIACASPSYTFDGEDPPAGWPCPITGTGNVSSGGSGNVPPPSSDAGPAPDAGGS